MRPADVPADLGATPATAATLLHQAVSTLMAAGLSPDDSRIDAGILLRHVLGWSAADLIARLPEPVLPDVAAAFAAATTRRATREPVAYITGRREFYGHSFQVTRDVLIPRPESELVVDAALDALAERRTAVAPRTWRIADVGTGSGCLAIALALHATDVTLTATDVSAAALAVARENAVRLGVASRIAFQEGSLLNDAAGVYDVVVANPPYIAEHARPLLMADVREFEPPVALYGGADGLDVFRALLPAAACALVPGGWLILEIGSDQAPDVIALAQATRRLMVDRVVADLAGHPRVCTLRRTGTDTASGRPL